MLVANSRSNIHPITKQYLERVKTAGGEVRDKKEINEFVTRLSAIISPDKWICWPLRSSQNIGEGSSVFSLGGMGVFNGSLVNGPVWTGDGLIFDFASSRYIQIPNSNSIGLGVTNFTVAAVSNTSAYNSSSVGLMSKAGLGSDTIANISWQLRYTNNSSVGIQITNGTIQAAAGSPAGSGPINQYNFSYGAMNNDVLSARSNGGTIVSSSALGMTTNLNGTHLLRFGLSAGSRYYTGTISFVIYIDGFVDSAELYAIYRETIGKGLGLT